MATSPFDRFVGAHRRGLGRHVMGFFAAPAPNPAVVVQVMPREELTSAWSRATIAALRPAGGARVLACIMITPASGGRSGTRLHAAPGEQFALIYEGDVTLTLPDHTSAHTQGDAVSLAAATPRQWQNPGAEPAWGLLVSAHVES